MHTSIHSSSFVRVYKVTILWCLICAVFFISHNAFAQTDPAVKDSIDIMEKQAAKGGDDDKSLPVEIGAGGDIKLERKYRTEMESQFGWHTHLLWESRYVSEGRDNLSGESLVSLSSDLTIDDVNFVPWVAHSPGADYTELNLNVVYATTLTEKLAASIGYNHIRARYQDERATDNEISLDLGYKLLKQTGLFASIYHSFEGKGPFSGSFINIGTRYFDPLSKKLHYSVAVSLGANAGYISDGHNGLNHFQINASASYLPVIKVEFYAYAGYSQAINRDAIRYAGDETLGDFFWGGVGLNYLF